MYMRVSALGQVTITTIFFRNYNCEPQLGRDERFVFRKVGHVEEQPEFVVVRKAVVYFTLCNMEANTEGSTLVP